jgi:hypothetical protein
LYVFHGYLLVASGALLDDLAVYLVGSWYISPFGGEKESKKFSRHTQQQQQQRKLPVSLDNNNTNNFTLSFNNSHMYVFFYLSIFFNESQLPVQ